MKQISVIMLTCDREALVGRMIESILAQTFRDFEFIIVDNGSSDGSGAVAERYAVLDSRIRVLHRERGNIGAGRNTGLDAAQGEWIAFVDDDDWCEPDFLECLHNLAVENSADIAICGAAGRECAEKHIYCPEKALIELLGRSKFNVQFPTKLLRRSLFSNLRFSETAMYDDIELMPRIMAEAGRIAYCGLSKYTFRRHDGNHSAWTTNYQLLDARTLTEYLRVYRDRTLWLCEQFPGNADCWRYFEWSFQISMVQKITRYGLTDCFPQRERLIQELRASYDAFVHAPWAQAFEKEWMEEYVLHEA